MSDLPKFDIHTDTWRKDPNELRWDLILRHNDYQTSAWSLTADDLGQLHEMLSNFLEQLHGSCEHWCAVRACVANCDNVNCNRCVIAP